MQEQLNLNEILAKRPEQITKEELTKIIKSIYSQNPALDKSSPYEIDPATATAGLPAVKETSCEELDDEYLPTCCRNGNPHSHSV